ncbi:MAG: NUDIX hydrolase [Anaerolineae bacterium]
MNPWRTLASRPLLDRRPWLTIWEEDVQLPNGQYIKGYLRAEARDYAMVFALLADGTVPLVHQYKHGIAAGSYDLPAGYLDEPAEPPLAAAQRELHEETGLRAHSWQPLGHLVIDTNRGATQAHIFLARDAYPAGPAHPDATEALTVSYHTPEELRVLVRSGQINSLASVAGILLALDALSGQ